MGTQDNTFNGAGAQVVAFDSRGKVLKTLALGGEDLEVTGAVAKAADGSFVIAGYSSEVTKPVIWHVDANLTGSTEIAYDIFDGSVPTHLVAMPDGGWLLGGHNYNGFERAGELARIAPDGTLAWRHLMGSERYTGLSALAVAPSGAITAAGYFWDKENTSTSWVMRLDDACR